MSARVFKEPTGVRGGLWVSAQRRKLVGESSRGERSLLLPLYEVPVERQVLCMEEELRELSGPVYKETEETVVQIDTGSLFPRPVWNAYNILNLTNEGTALYLESFRAETRKADTAEQEYRKKRRMEKEEIRRKEEDHRRIKEEERRRQDKERKKQLKGTQV